MHDAEPGQRVLIFRVADHLCAVNIDVVQEIVPLAATMRLPGQPSIVEGFLNLRGQAVSVVRLARCFGSPLAEADLHSAIIVVRMSGLSAGFLVDAVDGIATIGGDALQPLGQEYSFNNCAIARFSFEGGDVALLSADRLLLEQERSCIADLSEQARNRLAELQGAGT